MDELGFIGEPLWLSGKVMECENKLNQKIPGSLVKLCLMYLQARRRPFMYTWLTMF
jgi:hypothetical protein